MKTQLAVLAALGLIQSNALITRGGHRYQSTSKTEAQKVAEIKRRIDTSNATNP
jgi:hypothetical protein